MTEAIRIIRTKDKNTYRAQLILEDGRWIIENGHTVTTKNALAEHSPKDLEKEIKKTLRAYKKRQRESERVARREERAARKFQNLYQDDPTEETLVI